MIITDSKIVVLLDDIIAMIAKGPSFCHVVKIMALGQDIMFIVGGNQK